MAAALTLAGARVEEHEDGLTIHGSGGARLRGVKPIVRCVATHVNLDTGERDIDMVDMLRQNFGRDTLGTYFSVTGSGSVAIGDTLEA